MEPLDHLRVVDTTTDVAGPYASKLFVDAGAEVIKVEPTGGDPARRYSAVGARFEGDSALFGFLNAKKRSIVGTIGEPAIEALLEGADLLIESGTVDVESIRARYSHLVVLSITPFGLTGPYASRPATEFTIQARERVDPVPRSSGAGAAHRRRPPRRIHGRCVRWASSACGGPPSSPHRQRGAHRLVDDRRRGGDGADLLEPAPSALGGTGVDNAGPQHGDAVDRDGEGTGTSGSTPTPARCSRGSWS